MMDNITQSLIELIKAGTWLAPWAIIGYVLLKITPAVCFLMGIIYVTKAVVTKLVPSILEARYTKLSSEVTELRKSTRDILKLHKLVDENFRSPYEC